MNNIKSARLKAGYSQKQVAFELSVSAPTVSEWESGKKNPIAKNLQRMAELFNVSTDYLLGRVDEPNAEIPVALSSPKGYDKLTDEQREQINQLIDLFTKK